MEAQSELDNLFESGNVDKAMQMAFAMLSANTDTDASSVSVNFCALQLPNTPSLVDVPKSKDEHFCKVTNLIS